MTVPSATPGDAAPATPGPVGEAAPSPGGQVTPDERRTVLAVIDMQHVFGDAGSPWFTPRFGEIVTPVRRLAAAYGTTVFTRFVAPERPHGSWRAYYETWPFALQPPDAPLWDVVEDLADLATRPPVTAPTFGKWAGLAPIVGPGGRLVLCGVSTDCCVISTALAAADGGAEVLVVADACAGADDDSHAKALHVMGLYSPLVQVVDLDTALGLAAADPAAQPRE